MVDGEKNLRPHETKGAIPLDPTRALCLRGEGERKFPRRVNPGWSGHPHMRRRGEATGGGGPRPPRPLSDGYCQWPLDRGMDSWWYPQRKGEPGTGIPHSPSSRGGVSSGFLPGQNWKCVRVYSTNDQSFFFSFLDSRPELFTYPLRGKFLRTFLIKGVVLHERFKTKN